MLAFFNGFKRTFSIVEKSFQILGKIRKNDRRYFKDICGGESSGRNNFAVKPNGVSSPERS
jgi:hypothetical protein